MMLREFSQKLPDGSYESGSFCLLDHRQYNDGSREMVMVDRYHGLVLREYERNGHDDSDFVAVVWDEGLKSPRHITYATTRAWSYPCGCVVDATPEVLSEFEAYRAKKRAVWAEYERKTSAYIPRIGVVAKSITTRGKAKGLVGEIEWVGESTYGWAVKVHGVFINLDRIQIEVEGNWEFPAKWSHTFKRWSASQVPAP